ncbi:acyl-CoA dehydrogenase family protein [Streptomyces drozdowiczii]|uniref:Acyl-CoA dehydrogenase family protein n=1 Tax=Streptomyces drozdowiczii TaxID=202862 RepID=A0ABY6PZ74_9ACTN|nr:acyl-CoA dehydrogenase family protein [Streptomyces drozdowiczii]MCX0242269.1 acyl-CoA dehydrogenase family protein [Streptomyces drozdowiczii]UZK57660.1 acyl-CoA dehydrogenase family protein [Streptomyces drozdowiczii]
MTTTAPTSRTALKAHATQLLPLLKENAARTEADRRVAEENIEALTDAGLFRLTVPRRFGGHEADFGTFLDVTSELARGCGSTAWVATLVNVCNWMVGLYPERVQQEVFGENPDARVCGVLAPSASCRAVDGGLVVSGRWGFASGSLHAQSASLGIPVVDASGQQTDQGAALIPMDELTVEDTWYVAGMRGTGSNTLVADEVFVPEHRILSVTRGVRGDYPTEHTEEALYRSALVPVLALVLAGPQVGLAQAGMDVVRASLAKGKGISYTFYERASEAPSTQIQLAEAAQLIDTARLHLMRAADDIDSWAARGEYMPFETRARVRMDTGYVARRSREALDLLLSVQGAGSFAEASPLQRIWRDQETGSRHAVINPAIAGELYGRALLGIEEQVTPLI